MASDAAPAPPAADCQGLRFCEGFETQALGKAPGAPWRSFTRGGGVLVVDGTRPFGGARSLHITAPAGNDAAAVVNQRGPALPVPGNVMFGRVMVFFAGAPPRNTHFPLFEVQGVSTVAGNVLLRWGGNGVASPRGPPFHFNYKWTLPTAAESGATSSMLVPGSRWMCVQWQYDGPKNEARLWVDGKLQAQMTVLAARGWHFGEPWTFMQLGLQYFQPTPDAIELWLDDFALNDAMIPCPAAAPR
jgi:hypothetical protein